LILAGGIPTPSPGDCEVAAIRLRGKTGNRMLQRWQHPILIEDPNEHRKRIASLECEWKPGDSRHGYHPASGKAESARRKAGLCRIPPPAAGKEIACGSEEFGSPPFPFPPPGASRGGAGSPHAAGRLRASAEGEYGYGRLGERRWHASRRRLPPQEGFQIASLKPPLCIPPLQGSLWACGARKEIFFDFCLTTTGPLMEAATVGSGQLASATPRRIPRWISACA
jgi:hypothetical protein